MLHRLFVVAAALLVFAAPVFAQTDPLASMTLEHKVAQMFMVTLHGSVLTEAGANFLRTYHPGGVVLFAANVTTPDQATILTNNYQSTMREIGAPPMLIGVDQEGGVVTRLTDGFTTFPAPFVITAAGEE